MTGDLYWAVTRNWPPTVVDAQPAARLDRLRVAADAVAAGQAYRAEQDAGQRAALQRARDNST